MRRIIVSQIIAIVLFLLLSAGAVFSQTSGDRSNPQVNREVQEESLRKQKDKTSLQAGQVNEVQTVCANEVPQGWIQTNDRWDPMVCGKPAAITYNVWTIEMYRNKPVGSVLRACSGPVPRGWVMINDAWNPTSCGHPAAMTRNVMTIKRIE